MSAGASGEGLRFAVVVSRFNEEVTRGLLQGALGFLKEMGAAPASGDVFTAPGAFELPLIAQSLAQTGLYAGVVCLGCVIKGDTAHFEFISLGATVGLMHASLNTETPISFGVLTTYNDEQAISRSRVSGEGAAHNKGIEAAKACYESARLLRQISEMQ